jgi:hypothetical protein
MPEHTHIHTYIHFYLYRYSINFVMSRLFKIILEIVKGYTVICVSEMEAAFHVFLLHLRSSYKTTFRLCMTQEIEITMGRMIIKNT